ncbi:MAG TPA: hypothetical protein DCR04_13595 [Flavobacteriales bacterium]|nr:hypothetical protein [Flavobacteriales bacterium]
MKKLLLPVFLCLFSAPAMAQVCYADLSYAANGPGVYPFTVATPNCGDTLGTKTIVSITDTTVSITSPIMLDVTIYYDSTRVMSVSNLPPGLSFGTDVDGVTNANIPYGAWVNGGSFPNITPAVGCVYVHGPESAWLAAQSGGTSGVYTIQVEYDARIVQTVPDVSAFGVPNGTWLSDVDPMFGGGSININVPIDTYPSVQFELDTIIGDSVVDAVTFETYTATPGAAGYFWTVTGGAIISGQGSNEIEVLWEFGNPTGLVEVVAGDGQSCEQSESVIITSITASIFETATLNTRVYPNPSNGIFNIELETSDMVSLSVMDLSGKIVQAEQYSGSIHNLDLSGFEKGVYLLRLETTEGRAVSKVILN